MTLLPGRRTSYPESEDTSSVVRELTGFDEGQYRFVVHDFETQYLVAGPSDHKRRSPTFEVGGFTWSVMVSLHEKEGTWGVAAYLTLLNEHSTPLNVLPFVYCNFKVVNHVKDDKSMEQDFSHQYEEDSDKDEGEECHVESWGWHSICSRERLRRRTSQFLVNGALHVHAHVQVCLPDVDASPPRASSSKRASSSACMPSKKRRRVTDPTLHHVHASSPQKHLAMALATCDAPVIPPVSASGHTEADAVAAIAAPATDALGRCAKSKEGAEVVGPEMSPVIPPPQVDEPAPVAQPQLPPCVGAATLGPTQERVEPRSEVKIVGNKVTIRMPVSSPGVDAATAEQEHLHCAQLLFKHVPSKFDWSPKMMSPGPCVVTTIQQELLEQLPLLESIVSDFQSLPIGCSSAGAGGPRKSKKLKGKQVTRAPFEAPASACGLACMLLMLEGSLSPDELFGGDSPHGPSLASQTLWMTNYVGQKDVENTLHLWMGAVLCLLAMDKEQRAIHADMHKNPDLDRLLVSLQSWSAEWQSALSCIPPESVQAIITGGPGGTLWSPRSLRGAAVSQFSMLRLPTWMAEAWLKSFSQRLDLLHSDLPLSQSLKLLSVLPCNSELRSIQLSCRDHCIKGSLAFLNTFQSHLSSLQIRLPNLTVLNLHNVNIGEEHLPLLSGIFNVLKRQLIGLGLTVHDDCKKEVYSDTELKLRLFEAISRLSSLRVLLFPQWGKIVRKNVAVIMPLKKLSRLTVLVQQELKGSIMHAADGVVPGLQFAVVPERKFDFEMDYAYDD